MHARRRAFLAEAGARALIAGKSWPRFVNYVERRFRGPAETTEPGSTHNFPDTCLAGLGTQA